MSDDTITITISREDAEFMAEKAITPLEVAKACRAALKETE